MHLTWGRTFIIQLATEIRETDLAAISVGMFYPVRTPSIRCCDSPCSLYAHAHSPVLGRDALFLDPFWQCRPRK